MGTTSGRQGTEGKERLRPSQPPLGIHRQVGSHRPVFSLCLPHASLRGRGGAVPWLVDVYLLPVSSRRLPSVHVCLCIQSSPFYKDTSPIGLGPTMILTYYLSKDRISKYGHILGSWRLGFQHTFCGGHNSTHKRPFKMCHWVFSEFFPKAAYGGELVV